MENIHPVAKPAALDAPSEGLMIWEQPAFPQTDYAGFSLHGPCDDEALAKALVEAQERVPNYHAHLVPVRHGPFTVWGWLPTRGPVDLEIRDHTDLEEVPADLEAWVHERMRPAISGVMDLSREYPVRFILFHLPDDWHVLVFVFHHVVTDGGGLYDFLADAFTRYHALVTGETPDWAGVAGIHAQKGAVKPVRPISGWQVVKTLAAEWKKYPPWKCAQIASDPGDGQGRNMVRHIETDLSVQRALRDRARRDGGSLSDLFLTASKLALDEFNESRNAGHEIMVHGLAVNQRLRRDPKEIAGQGNPMGAVSVSSDSADRSVPQALLDYVIARRKQAMNEGHDVWLTRISKRLVQLSRVIPMSRRYRILRKIFDSRISFFVTNLGVVWPEIVDGRPTGKTAIRRIGHMDLVDIHSSVGATENNANALILRTFQDKLYMVFLFGRHRVNDADARAFSRLVVDKAYAFL